MHSRLLAATIAAGTAFVLIDAALWWASATVDSSVRPAFVGAAGGWSVAVVGIGGAILGARWNHHYQTRSALKHECRIAYGQLLRFATEFRSAQKNHEAAEREHQMALDRRGCLPASATRDQKEVADAAVRLSEAALSSANSRVSALLDDFSSASATVSLLAPNVQPEMEQLKRAFGGNGNIEEARSAFVRAALEDLN